MSVCHIECHAVIENLVSHLEQPTPTKHCNIVEVRVLTLDAQGDPYTPQYLFPPPEWQRGPY